MISPPRHQVDQMTDESSSNIIMAALQSNDDGDGQQNDDASSHNHDDDDLLIIDSQHNTNASSHSNNMNDDDYFTLFNYDDPLEDTIHEEETENHHLNNIDNMSMQQQSQQLFQLLNLPPSLMDRHSPTSDNHHNIGGAVVGYPVGGMRRVSSCYFSIASNISNSGGGGSFDVVNTGSGESSPTNQHQNQHTTSSSSSCLPISSILSTSSIHILFQHDILMNTFTYLDAQSLASFSETCKRCNFECFYFLELSLQRALLVGEISTTTTLPSSSSFTNTNHHYACDSNNNHKEEEEEEKEEYNSTMMIAGTGVISRLSRLNNARARQIVQLYLDSNASIRGMPMMYSLSYLRQMIRLHYNTNTNARHGGHGGDNVDNELGDEHEQRSEQAIHGGENSAQQQQQQHDGMMISTARNMALLFTFLGAAYKYQHGEVPNYLDEETMELMKGMMIKLGVAGGMGSFFKAVKEHQLLQQQGNEGGSGEGGDEVTAERESLREEMEGEHQGINDGGEQVEVQGMEMSKSIQQQDGMKAKARNMALFLTLLGAAYKVNAGEINIDEETMEVAKNMMIKLGLAGSLVKAGQLTIVKKEKEDHVGSDTEEKHEEMEGDNEGHLDGHPTSEVDEADTTTRSRNDRSSSLGSLEDLSNMIKHPSAIASRLYHAFQSPNSSTTNLDTVEERSDDSSGIGGNALNEAAPRKHRGKRSHFLRIDELQSEEGASIEASSGKSEVEPPTPEAITYAMDHPFSSNPYDHLSASEQKKSSIDASAATSAASSFLPFKISHFQPPWAVPEAYHATSPSGCIGAYANAVKSAASEVTRLVKEERKANFDALSEDEQMELGVRFIDACTSDDKIDIVKDILQNQKKMDVDRFFIGQDETETCALHAAAFNGAEKVLQFLCGGIDENDPSKDCGLCDVNVTDANGWTALHFAAGANSVLSVRVLAEHGAKLTVEAGNGYTPYHWAERLSNEEVASELESLGADNRFVGSWMFGSSANAGDRMVPFVSYLAQQFFGR